MVVHIPGLEMELLTPLWRWYILTVGVFWQVVAMEWCSLDHFILSSLTSERHSCDLLLHYLRHVGTSWLTWHRQGFMYFISSSLEVATKQFLSCRFY